MKRFLSVMVGGWLALVPSFLWADDDTIASVAVGEKVESVAAKPSLIFESIIEKARHSIAVVYFTNRDGIQQGVGSGMIIDSDGLIATNLHVIGQARPIYVMFADGKTLPATAVHASDRDLDLALVRINAKDLPALELGDSDTINQGQMCVAIGNPFGLENSAVKGVVSAVREIEGRPMIQLAMPIEPGNSGGPVLDANGRVLGIITLKSAMTPNLGFAVPINQLKRLIERPNPIPINRWLTIGAINAKQWQSYLAAPWRQRAGRLIVDRGRDGLGGRGLLLSNRDVPSRPFEIGVEVRLEHPLGAAGLAFGADEKHRTYYGFYPSAGELRLTHFAGPNVRHWKILEQVNSRHYRVGNWNALKVRLEKDWIYCYVNGHQVMKTKAPPEEGRMGLASFRWTSAQFRHFQFGPTLAPDSIPVDILAQIDKVLEDLPSNGALPASIVDRLEPHAVTTHKVLRKRANGLRNQADQLERLVRAVHQNHVRSQLTALLNQGEENIDLFRAALLITQMDNAEVEVDFYRRELDRMADELRRMLDEGADDESKLAALNDYLFEENGFHGSRMVYYHRSNSYMNEVMDDREGLPITLSVLYIELGRRIGLNLVGAALPGHFMVRHLSPQENGHDLKDLRLIDVFEGGKFLTRAEAAAKVRIITGLELSDEFLQATTKKAIIVRMLRNLVSVVAQDGPRDAVLPYLETILDLEPNAAYEQQLKKLLDGQESVADEVEIIE